MSSSSNLSWCTAESDPIVYDDIRRISMDFIAEAKECKATTIDNDIERAQNTYHSNEEIHGSPNNCFCNKIPTMVVQLRKIPWFIVMISLVQITAYFIARNDSVALLMFKPQQKYDLWRYFTYHLIHFSSTHLVLNVFLQILIAYSLETEQGHFRILIVYFSGVGFGAFGSLYFNSKQAIIGSSAGVYGLLCSHISHCILNWSSVQRRKFRLASVFLLIGGDFLFATLKYCYWSNIGPKVSVSAHIWGGIAGFLTAFVVFNEKR